MESPIECQVPEKPGDLYPLILNPSTLVGRNFSQKWESNDGEASIWYLGYIESVGTITVGLLDFKVSYDDDNHCYLYPKQIIADIIRGNLDLRRVGLLHVKGSYFSADLSRRVLTEQSPRCLSMARIAHPLCVRLSALYLSVSIHTTVKPLYNGLQGTV